MRENFRVIYFSGTTALSVQGYRNSERLPVCVRVYVCMSATFVARLVAIKDEDGDTCLVVFG